MNFICQPNPAKILLCMAWFLLLCVKLPTVAIIILTVATVWVIYNDIGKLYNTKN